jgi:hypothetical protein
MAALLPLRAQAQVLCALGPTSPPYEPMADMPASAGAQAELKKIKTLLCPKGCGKVLLFANATTPNTATVTDGAGVSKISYSPSFANSVRSNYGPAGTFGILAHALGHHLEASGNRPAWMKDAWDSELRADAWAGCAIAKAEMTPSRLQAVLLAMSSYPSSHHPPWSERRPVITEGYTRCGGRILPPLAKETAELAVKSDKNNDKHSGGEPVTVAIGLGGCTGDRDCRNGRACVNSHCVTAPERKRCGKDIDCPEPQECGPSGVCVRDAQPGARRGRGAEAAGAAAGVAAGTEGRHVVVGCRHDGRAGHGHQRRPHLPPRVRRGPQPVRRRRHQRDQQVPAVDPIGSRLPLMRVPELSGRKPGLLQPVRERLREGQGLRRGEPGPRLPGRRRALPDAVQVASSF